MFGDENTNPLVAYLGEDETMRLRTTKVIYDCLDPEHLQCKLPRRPPFAPIFPAELQAKVLAGWSAYGYPIPPAIPPA